MQYIMPVMQYIFFPDTSFAEQSYASDSGLKGNMTSLY